MLVCNECVHYKKGNLCKKHELLPAKVAMARKCLGRDFNPKFLYLRPKEKRVLTHIKFTEDDAY